MSETAEIHRPGPGDIEGAESMAARHSFSSQAGEQSSSVPKEDAAAQKSAERYLPQLDITDSGADSSSSKAGSPWGNEVKNADFILIRHADKPDDPSNPDLSPAGFARAQELPAWFQKEFGKNPDFLFAAADSNASNRPSETLGPTSQESGVPIDKSISNKNYGELASELDNKTFDGKSVAIAWHHGEIEQLATALGAPAGTFSAPWDKNDYDDAIDIHYGADGTPTVSLIKEDLNAPAINGTKATTD